MAKPIIAVDIDDVLAANAKGFVEYTNRMWGLSLTVQDYDEHWAKLWGVDNEETSRRSDEMHASGVFAYHEHFPAAKPVLKHLRERYELVIVTSRRKVIQNVTYQWIDRYFPGIFSDIHFVGIWDTITDSSIHMTKGDALKTIGATYLIDDQLKHCLSAGEHGVDAVLFGDYGWNQYETKLPDHITRCDDWQAIREYFDAKS